jgi:hypothetical protein
MNDYAFPWADHRDSPHAQFLGKHFSADYFDRPVLVERAATTGVEDSLNTVVDLLLAAPDRLFGGDFAAFGRSLGYDDRRLAFADPDEVGPACRIGRADLHRTTTAFRLLELNLSSAVGGMQMSRLGRLFLEDPSLARHLAEHGFNLRDTVPALRRFLGGGGEPGAEVTVALVADPAQYATSRAEMTAVAELVTGQELTAVVPDPRDLVIGPRGVAWRGRRVDVVWRMFTLAQVVEGSGESWSARLVRDLRRLGVPLVSPITTSFFGSKNALALLSAPGFRSRMTPAERAAVDRILPLSFRLGDPAVDLGDGARPASEVCLAHRETLVIKPAFGRMGQGVTVGRDSTADEWAAVVRSSDPATTMVQELVVPEAEHLTTQQSPDAVAWHLVHGMFLVGTEMAGGFVRGNRATGDLVIVNGEAKGPLFFQDELHSVFM